MMTDRDTTHQAKKEGCICGECGRKLKPNDPVWRERLFVSGYSSRQMAPVCKKCHGRSYGRYEEAKPCEGCGRPVHNPYDLVGRLHSFCSEICQRKVLAAKAEAAAREKRAEVRGPSRSCKGCGNTFTPTRNDAQFCSGSCRQRAYRRRVTDNKKTGGRLFAKRNAGRQQRRVTNNKKRGGASFAKRNARG
jgi:hypothetical protein